MGLELVWRKKLAKSGVPESSKSDDQVVGGCRQKNDGYMLIRIDHTRRKVCSVYAHVEEVYDSYIHRNFREPANYNA